MVTVGLVSVALFSLMSMTYVYLLRGEARYEGLSEYLRKGWPIFTPFNCLLYLFTQKRARMPIMNIKDFPELEEVHKNWDVIRDEARKLYENKFFEKINQPGAGSYYDIGFRTFYKYGWSKFYLTWYGHTVESALQFCPKTVEILKRVPSINGAMFSYLPAGSKLTRHLDPIACSLRYHLGLITPNSDQCYINVDNRTYSWRDSDPFLFDETYLHFAQNNSQQDRIILMCDVDRPMFFIGGLVNFFYKGLARLTVVPNIEGDKRGLVNRVFSSLAPLLQKSKNLKATNRPAYLALKYTVNTILVVLVFLLIAGLFKVIGLAGGIS